jgi:potassium efflux system protein
MILCGPPDSDLANRSRWLAWRCILLGGALLILGAARPALVQTAPVRTGQVGPVAFPAPAAASRPASMPASQPATQAASQPTTQAASQPATAPSSQPAESEITPAAIEAAKTRVQAAQDLPEAQKKQILDAYDQALAQIKVADDWRKRAAQFEEVAKQAPAQLAEAKAKWAKPVEDLTPHVAENAPLGEIEQQVKHAEELDRDARNAVRAIEQQRQDAVDRKTTIRARGEAIHQAVAKITEELTNLATGTSEADQAHRIYLRARRRALYRELAALDKQSAADDARTDLLAVQQDLANRYRTATSQALEKWKLILDTRRAAEAAAVAATASQESMTFRNQPELFAIAEQNKSLARQRVELQDLAAELQESMQPIDEVRRERRDVTDSLDSMVKRINAVGLTEAISALLRRHRAELPNVLQHERNYRRLEAAISKAQAELIDLQDQRAGLADIDRQTRQVMRGLRRPASLQEQEDLRAQVQDLLRTRRKYLDDLIRDYNTFTKNWLDQAQEEHLLIAETDKYAAYIDEHILWVRSTRPLRPADARYTWQAIRWFASPAGWLEVGRGLWSDSLDSPVTDLAGVVVFVLLLWARPRLRSRLQAVDEMASRSYTYAFVHTLEAMALTVLMAVAWPFLVWFLGWRLSTVVATGEFVGALAAGLRDSGVLLATLEIVRHVCRKRGLGETHFRWTAASMAQLRANLVWLEPLVVPSVFVVSTVDAQTSADYRDSLGRLAFIVSAVAVAVFTKRVLPPGAALVGDFLRQHRNGWLDRLRYVWYPVAVGLPAVLAGAAALGYYYTAMQLAGRLMATAGLVFVAIVVRALLLRLLFVGRRRLAIEEARKRQAARPPGPVAEPQAEARPAAPPAGPAGPAPREDQVDLATVDAQTRRLLRVGILFGVAIGLYLIWANILPALGILDRVQLWSTTVEVSQSVPGPGGSTTTQVVRKVVPITLGSICLAGLIVLAAIVAARNIPGLLEITILRVLPLDAGARYAVNAMSRYIITAVGLVIAFSAIGIGWSKVQWLVAAVTVGLGFGLQEIFANFVSGIIILFERPIRVGDTVTIGSISGTVSRIRIRATTITDWDRKELIVPNKEFITAQLINWTLSDPMLRVVVDVGVAYGSDTRQVQTLLEQAARQNPHVLADPPPGVFFVGFGQSSLDFSLRAFVPSVSLAFMVKHQLHMAIDEAFRQAGIEIAFPQRDVHIRSINFEGLGPALRPPDTTGQS